MKKLFFVLAFFMLGAISYSQLSSYKYLIKFTDKNYSPYSISNPSQFLSAKAIARRTRQGISIKYNDLPVSLAYIDSVLSTGVTVICQSRWFNSVTIYTTNPVAINKIRSFPFVVNIDTVAKIMRHDLQYSIPDKMMEPIENIISTQNDFNNERTNNNLNYGLAFNQIDMIDGDSLHNRGFEGQGMTIAVIDAGFYNVDSISAFDSLWINNQILGTKDFVESGGNVFRNHYHGMMVLSTMGANISGKIIGTAPKAKYWLLRSEYVNSENVIEEFNWASAAEFADSVGVDVINTSLGYTTFDSIWMSHIYNDMNGHTCPSSIAATIAASKGIIVCASAGNSGNNSWHYIGAPADADSIITVGAVNASGDYAYFSSMGPTADGRIKPTVVTQGQSTVVISTSGIPVGGNGTSFSSPVMTGATACLWQAFPNATNMQVIEAIKKSASQYLNPDNQLGYGIPNFSVAYHLLSGIKIHDDNSEIFFPNPFSNILNVLFYSNDTNSYDIDIYNISGKKVFSEKGISKKTGYNFHSLSIANSLANGLYFIRITSDDKVFSGKIIKANS